MTTLTVLRPGLATMAQDLGVRGRAHQGVSRGGAFDMRSLALANLAVGNAAGAMGLEVLLQGPRLLANAPCVVAWCGATFDVDVSGVPVPALHAVALAAGQVLRVGRCARGARCAIAFAGGLVVERGSRIDYHGVLALGAADKEGAARRRALVAPIVEEPMTLRVTDSLHSELFSASSRAALLGGAFVVDSASDRRGVRLHGDGLAFPLHGDVATVGVTLGAVQVTRGGQAILLGVDQTTTGGYPIIAHVIRADAWRIGQLRPTASVRFERVGFDQARRIWLDGDRCG